MSVFQPLQSEIVKNVSLIDLIPQLNLEELLSDREEQLLLNQNTTEYDRKLVLTSILRTKGPEAPSKFVRCLRNTHDPGHLYLADIIEAKIAEAQIRQASTAPTVDGWVPTSSHCAASYGALPRVPPVSNDLTRVETFPPNPAPTRPTVNASGFSQPYHMSSPTRQPPFFTPGQPQICQHAVPHSFSSSMQSKPSASSSLSNADSVESLPFEFRASVEEQGGPLTVVSQYSSLIGDISTMLASRGISFTSFKANLLSIMEERCISLVIPDGITTVPSLLQFLRVQQMCHEYDVDLLCEILDRLQQPDLNQEVLTYSQTIMQHDILHCSLTHTAPTPHHFLAFTVHNCPSLTYAQACEVKRVLSNLLDVDRHTFWLSSSESGSVVLGWNFREEQAKYILAKLENKSFQQELLSAQKMHNLTAIKTLFVGAEKRHKIFSIQSSSILQQSSPSSTHTRQIISSSSASTTSHSLSHLMDEGEGEVSSSTEIPAAMDVSKDTEPMLRAGTKRKQTIDSTDFESSDVETDGTKRPLSKRSKHLVTAGTPQPEPKHIALQTGAQGGGLHIEGVSPQQFSQQHVTPRFQKSEHDSDYRRVLRENQLFIVENLNLMSVLPHLNAHLLLTEAENDEMQLRNVLEHDRIMKLVTILAKKGEDGFHRFLAALEKASDHLMHGTIAETLKQSLSRLPRPTSTQSPTPPSVLVNHLRAWYKTEHFFYGAAGPHIKDVQFIRLALVTKQGVSEVDKWKDDFLKATLHGNLEDIVKKKYRLKMDEIFRYGNKLRKLVLVEGAPGVGKTMLAMKLCAQWAQSEALQEYDIVLFVELRRFQGETKLNLKTIVGSFVEDEEEMTKEVIQYLVKTQGKGLLIILEGWDELSPALRRQHSWLFDLIKGTKLPQASIMVTSRPSVTAPLYDYMDERRIEVLGFDEEQQNEYILKNISDKTVAQRVWDHLQQFPNLRALAHIPLTLAIICSVAIQSKTLPVTLTELYKKYICHLFFDYLCKNPDASLDTLVGLDSLEVLPEEERGILVALCKLALSGFKQKAFIFESSDLEELGLQTSVGFDGCGLLTARTQIATAGRKPLYQFRHLSIQEYLAGLEINGLSPEERLCLLTDFRKDKQFQNIWKFLSGISKLQDEAFCCQLVGPIIRKSSRDQLFLLHCLYEAQNREICHVAANKMERILHLDNTTLNATDCLCTAYVMGSAEGDWQVNLRGCNIGGDGLEVFKWQLKAHDSQDLKITLLDLTHNQLDASAMTHLTEMFLQLQARILRVKIESNKIGDEGVRVLSMALKEKQTTVTQLLFRDCGLTSEAAKWFADALKCNTTFKNVYFGFDNLGDRGAQYIASALHDNTTLEELGLASVGLTSVGLTYLADALKLNHTLKIIRIDRNKLGASECHIIADILRTHQTLDLIDISRNPIGDEGFSTIMDALIERPDALKKLGAYGCDISSKKLQKLIVFFQKTTVFKAMHIGLNNIGDEGAELIAQAVEQNKSESVKEIYIENSHLTEKGEQRIKEAEALREDLMLTFAQNAAVEKMREKMKEELRPQ